MYTYPENSKIYNMTIHLYSECHICTMLNNNLHVLAYIYTFSTGTDSCHVTFFDKHNHFCIYKERERSPVLDTTKHIAICHVT